MACIETSLLLPLSDNNNKNFTHEIVHISANVSVVTCTELTNCEGQYEASYLFSQKM